MRSSLIAAVFFTAWTTPAWAQHDLRGFKLGMTLEQFRATKNPDYPDAQVICKGDPETNNLLTRGLTELWVTSISAEWGAIGCRYYRPNSLTKDLRDAGLKVATVGTYVTYYFARDRLGGNQRILYRIEVGSNVAYWDTFMEGFVGKYGKPTSLKNEVVQNALGAKFDRVIAVWSGPQSKITLTKRASEINLVSIIYSFTPLDDAMRKREKEVKGKPQDNL